MLLPAVMLPAVALCVDCNTNRVEDARDGAPGSVLFPVQLEGDRPPPGARALEFVDLNGDGRLDVAAAGPSQVTLLVADQRGSLQESQALILGTPPVMIAAADLDGDGTPDLVTANQGPTRDLPDNVTILLNRGGGSFARPRHFASGPANSALVVADLDQDGHVDLVTVNQPTQGGEGVTFLWNDGTGGFSSATSAYAGYQLPCQLVAGDLDADGDLDLVTARHEAIHVLMNPGGRDYPRVNPHVFEREEPLSIQILDFCQDGRHDLLMASVFSRYDPPTASIVQLKSDGHGNLVERKALASIPLYVRVEVSATGRDGANHIALFHVSRPEVTVLRVARGGIETVGQHVGPQGRMNWLGFVDWNAEGVEDLAVLHGTNGILYTPLDGGAARFHRGDATADGRLDLADAVHIATHAMLS